jgi:hypothetical protein
MEGEFFTVKPACLIIDLMSDRLRMFLMVVDLLSKLRKFAQIHLRACCLLCTFAMFFVLTLRVSQYQPPV